MENPQPPSNNNLSSSNSNALRSNKLLCTGDFKQEKSHDFFKGTRVSSCSFVKVKGNVALAQPYYAKPQMSYADKMGKSSYTSSFSYEQFKPRPNLHCGTTKKPLEPYNPTSYRSRLPLPDNKLPSKNSSQIEIGDRAEKYTRHFISNSRNQYGNFGKIDPVTNTGILAERTKWHHYLQNK